ncbi:cation diffusion facilitator family transporter [Desulfurivibrio sp. C05AmB]|uniref:cation diffusion facilitator family transporter n=1 Tax=Desulfurivibrio sp. C05AmB TaxID=3374371 RepID=UPI00376F08BC
MSLSTGNSDGKSTSLDSQEYADLKKYIFWLIATLAPLTAINIAIAILSDSLTIFTIAVENAASLILHSFNMAAVIVIQRRNSFNFPYGTGKLENFSSFLYSIIVILITMVIINSALNRYLHPPATINLGLAQITLVLAILRAWVMVAWASRLCRRYSDHSPMTHSYYVDLKLTLVLNLSVSAGLLLGLWLFSEGQIQAAVTVDLIIGLSVVLYMFYCAIGLLVKNFKSLIDLPLPEGDQHKILKALVADFDTYEGIGNFYTQLSGSTRFVQMELYFKETTTVEEIENLRIRLEERLRVHFSKLVFHLIPLIQKP